MHGKFHAKKDLSVFNCTIWINIEYCNTELFGNRKMERLYILKGWVIIFRHQFKGGLQIFEQLLRGGLPKLQTPTIWFSHVLSGSQYSSHRTCNSMICVITHIQEKSKSSILQFLKSFWSCFAKRIPYFTAVIEVWANNLHFTFTFIKFAKPT
jgi:hypothetical protein